MKITQIIFVICLIFPLCLAQVGVHIIFGTEPALVVTLIPRTPSPSLTLSSLNINDPLQRWNFANGYISSFSSAYNNFVFDVSSASTMDGAPVILYSKTTPIAHNQQWTLQSDGSFTSNLAPNFALKPTPARTGLIVSYAVPRAIPVLKTPVFLPWLCYSFTDPHISPYSTGRQDILHPGSQMPGTYILSKTGRSTDPDYLMIQADQQADVRGSSVYCNKRLTVQNQGQVVLISGENATVNGIQITISNGATYVVGNGVNITRTAWNEYLIHFVNGNVRIYSIFHSKDVVGWANIYITLTGGRQPTGGACTQYPGDYRPGLSKRDEPLGPIDFLISWRVPNWTVDLFNYSSLLSWTHANPTAFNTSYGNLTTNNTALRNAAIAQCAPLLPSSTLAAQCEGLPGDAALPSMGYYFSCVDDVIGTGQLKIAAGVIDSYTSKCSKYGHSKNVTVVLPVSASNSIVTGLTALVLVNTSSSFNITSRDVDGKIVDTNGAENYTVTVSGPGLSINKAVFLGSGIYNVVWFAGVAGIYSISIKLGYNEIRNSPFEITVMVPPTTAPPTPFPTLAPGSASAALSTDDGPTRVEAGDTVYVTVTARDALGATRNVGGDLVTVKITGRAAVSKVKDNGDGTYSFRYQPNYVGKFTVTIKLNGEEIQNNPYEVVSY